MKYVILGASGHIGNNFVRYINKIEPNAEINVLVRRKIEKELQGAKCNQIIGDICDYNFLLENINSEDIVIHSAGVIDLQNKLKEQTYNVNFSSVKLCADACKEKGAKLVYIGSVDGIYRTGEEEQIIEPENYYPENMKGNYSQTKAMAMKLIHDKIIAGENISMIMPSAVIGINDFKPSEVGKIIQGIIKGKAEFGLKGGYNFVNVIDVCKAIYSACHSEVNGEYIISGTDVTIKEFYKKINETLNIKKRPIILPDFIIYLALPFVKMLNKGMVKALKDSHNYSSEKAKKELNYEISDIDQTIKETVEWFNQNK